jgi:hypothetical protein
MALTRRNIYNHGPGYAVLAAWALQDSGALGLGPNVYRVAFFDSALRTDLEAVNGGLGSGNAHPYDGDTFWAAIAEEITTDVASPSSVTINGTGYSLSRHDQADQL